MSINHNIYHLNLQKILGKDFRQHICQKSYHSDDILYHRSAHPMNLYIYLSGQLKICKDKSQMMHCDLGELIGAYASFANVCYRETLQFISPGQIIAIDFEYFKKCLTHYPIYNEKIVECLCNKQKIITTLSTI